MNKNYLSEVIISIIIIVIAGSLLMPTGLLMPMSFDKILPLSLITAFLFFSVFIWKERKGDERDQLHILSAGRVSFFAGAAALVLGIVVQSLQHDIDPWLIFALIVMITAKLASRIYSDLNQ